MKKLLFYTMILLFATAQNSNAQINITYNNKSDNEIKLDLVQLEKQKEVIETRELQKLKEEVEVINTSLKNGDITEEEADKLKQDAAEKRAKNIQEETDVIDANISLLKRNEMKEWDYYAKLKYLVSDKDDSKSDKAETVAKKDTTPRKIRKTFVRATAAWGFSNAIVPGQSFNNSPYNIGKSQFFDIGINISSALFKSKFVRLNYGVNFQFNGLNPTDNQIFVRNDDAVELEEFAFPLKKSKLRIDNLVIPVHFEFGKANSRYRANKFKVGIGGFVGINLGDVQKLKYQEDGIRVKEKTRNNYRSSNYVYGLSAYVGYNAFSLYARYNLNPIFKSNPVDEHSVAIGLRVVI